MTQLLFRILFFSIVSFLPSVMAGAKIRAEHTSVALIGGHGTADGVVIGIEFVLDPEWHIYWKNPGDSGAAPKFKFQITGGTISEVRWPTPERIRLGDLTNYGYAHRVVFPFTLQPRKSARAVRVQADLEWLVCKVECVPGFAKLDAVYPIGKSGIFPELPPNAPLPGDSSPFSLQLATRDTSGIELTLDSTTENLAQIREIDLFPEDGELFTTAAPTISLANHQITARIAWATNGNQSTPATSLLLKVRDALGVRAFSHTVDLAAVMPWRSLFRAILFAFVGGILLNLMPCVFPVLSIKVLSLIRESRDARKTRNGGWLYAAGVLVTFLALAAVLLVLRAGGEQLGWGFQLQSPRFVLAMAMLFFLVGLNFLGALDVGDGLMRFAGRLGGAASSSFSTGVLATLVATPCTAPFMGTALGVSLLLPWWGSLVVFGALGAGMAAPFVVLCHFPGTLSRLPRPGPWMERIKEFFAFPLFATSVWLGWVLVQQTGSGGFLIFGLGLVGIALGGWVRKNRRALGVLIALLSLLAAVILIQPVDKSATTAASRWQPYDTKKIADVRAKGEPVFIDFTASWCLTCQWNKKSVFETVPVETLFEKNGVQLFRADWTDRDPQITQALAQFGRNSVPLYIFFPRKGDAVILPELISRGDLERLFP